VEEQQIKESIGDNLDPVPVLLDPRLEIINKFLSN